MAGQVEAGTRGGPSPRTRQQPAPVPAMAALHRPQEETSPGVHDRRPELVPLNDANVSRRHAEFRSAGRNFVIADLGSTNGTKVNGNRIIGEHTLADGDIISFGGTHIRFEAS